MSVPEHQIEHTNSFILGEMISALRDRDHGPNRDEIDSIIEQEVEQVLVDCPDKNWSDMMRAQIIPNSDEGSFVFDGGGEDDWSV